MPRERSDFRLGGRELTFVQELILAFEVANEELLPQVYETWCNGRQVCRVIKCRLITPDAIWGGIIVSSIYPSAILMAGPIETYKRAAIGEVNVCPVLMKTRIVFKTAIVGTVLSSSSFDSTGGISASQKCSVDGGC